MTIIERILAITADEIREVAKRYYGDTQFFIDMDERVAHPACSDQGCCAIRIEAVGQAEKLVWVEGYWHPSRPFRPL